MGDHDGAAGELQQGVLQRAEGLDVQVVGGLVEQQQVAALLEGEREVQAVALATGQDARGFCWSGPLKPNEAT